jgi:chromosome segregation ATPase
MMSEEKKQSISLTPEQLLQINTFEKKVENLKSLIDKYSHDIPSRQSEALQLEKDVDNLTAKKENLAKEIKSSEDRLLEVTQEVDSIKIASEAKLKEEKERNDAIVLKETDINNRTADLRLKENNYLMAKDKLNDSVKIHEADKEKFRQKVGILDIALNSLK